MAGGQQILIWHDHWGLPPAPDYRGTWLCHQAISLSWAGSGTRLRCASAPLIFGSASRGSVQECDQRRTATSAQLMMQPMAMMRFEETIIDDDLLEAEAEQVGHRLAGAGSSSRCESSCCLCYGPRPYKDSSRQYAWRLLMPPPRTSVFNSGGLPSRWSTSLAQW